MITRLLRQRNFINETVLPRQFTFESAKKFDVERFGKKVQVTKIGKLPETRKEKIRNKIKAIKKLIKEGIAEDVDASNELIKKLEDQLKGGVISSFEEKLTDLKKLLLAGRTEDRASIEKLIDITSVLFAKVNLKNINRLSEKNLRVVLVGLKTMGWTQDLQSKEYALLVQTAGENPGNYITGIQYNDPNVNPNLSSISAVYALRTHNLKTNLQNTEGNLSPRKPVWVWDEVLERFDPARLSRLDAIGRNEDFYLKHRAIIPRSFDIDEKGEPFETQGIEEIETEEEIAIEEKETERARRTRLAEESLERRRRKKAEEEETETEAEKIQRRLEALEGEIEGEEGLDLFA